MTAVHRFRVTDRALREYVLERDWASPVVRKAPDGEYRPTDRVEFASTDLPLLRSLFSLAMMTIPELRDAALAARKRYDRLYFGFPYFSADKLAQESQPRGPECESPPTQPAPS